MNPYSAVAVVVLASLAGVACAGSTPPANDVSGSPTSNTDAKTDPGFGDETNSPPTSNVPASHDNSPDNGSTRGTGTDASPAGTGSSPGLTGGGSSSSGPGGNGTGK